MRHDGRPHPLPHGARAFEVVGGDHDSHAPERGVGKIDVGVSVGELPGQLAERHGPVLDLDHEDLTLISDPYCGTSFAYSGDTQWTPALARAAQGADLFAVEAYTFDRPVRYHLDYQTLRAHLGEIGARRIVLTHMSGAMLNRLADADLPAAYDGMTADL